MNDAGFTERLTRARLRQLRALLTARGRREQRRFLLDGEKLVRDAIAADAPIEELLSVSPQRWSDSGLPMTRLTQADSERLSDTRTPQGHFAIARDLLGEPQVPESTSWQIVALDAVQDTGNVGGIIRSAAAFGVASVLAGPGTADPTHPRVLRAATGAWFHVSISRVPDLAEQLHALRAHGARIMAADAVGAPLIDTKIPDKAVWLFGNEGSGTDSQFDPLIDERVAIPIAESVESLNVNVAAGIILHHVHQQARERGAI